MGGGRRRSPQLQPRLQRRRETTRAPWRSRAMDTVRRSRGGRETIHTSPDNALLGVLRCSWKSALPSDGDSLLNAPTGLRLCLPVAPACTLLHCRPWASLTTYEHHQCALLSQRHCHTEGLICTRGAYVRERVPRVRRAREGTRGAARVLLRWRNMCCNTEFARYAQAWSTA